ncbi:TonB-dependent receptor [Sphingobium sp. AN558]|uniref:TonB-dependent receptor n=1 Tax=Sphingobium sp. AN558 TaxID=3133442 RepID=UPI0030BBDD33
MSRISLGRSIILSGSAMVAVLVQPGIAGAQTLPEKGNSGQVAPGDIIVTAQRRSERLQDVPVAITAVDATVAQQLGLRRTRDLNLIAPGVNFADTPGVMSFYIRGIGSQYQNPGIEGSVAVYIDGTYLPRSHGTQSLLNLVDPGTVQVLRGPQGTLYGRNATGGVLLLASAEPTSKFEGRVAAEYGRFNHQQLDGMLNVPISNTLSVRFSGRYQHDDGYIKNLATGRHLMGGNNYVARGQIRWQPSDDVDVVAGVEYNKAKNRRAISQMAVGAPICLVCQTTGQQPASGFYQTRQNDPDPWTNRMFRAFMRANVTIGQFDFSSVTTYFRDRNVQSSDTDYTTSPSFYFDVDQMGGETFSQAFQIVSKLDGPFDFVGGVEYLHDNGKGIIALRGTDYQFAVNAFGSFPQNTSKVLTKSLSGFLEGSYKITDQVKITAGGRYTQDQRSASLRNSSGFIGFGAPATASGEKSFSAFTPRFVLAWDNGPMNLYYSYTRGFKAGGINTPAIFGIGTVKPEKIFSHEVGMKNSFMENKVQTSMSVFYYKNKDLQTQIIDPTGGGSRLENAGGVKGYGAEFELNTQPVAGLNLGGAVSYLHTEFFDYANASQTCYDPTVTTGAALFPCPIGPKTNLNGVRAPNAPKWQLSLHGSYDFPIGAWTGNLAGLVSYRSSFDYVVNAGGYDLQWDQQEGYVVSNISGYVSPPGGNIRVGFYLDNAFGKKYTFSRVTNQPYGLGYAAAPPRTYGLRAEYRF